MGARLPGWRPPSRQSMIALGLYGSLSIAYFGLHVVLHLSSRCVCVGPNGDPSTYMWFLAWWPHALLSGHNPFVTDVLWAPGPLNVGAVALMPGPAIFATPFTLLFGPLVSFNLLALAAPVLAAFFAFRLCRYVSGSFPAALVGGYIFGFASYMTAHLLGHLDLVQTFPIPAIVHLTLRLIDGRIGRRRFVAAGGALLTALLLCSPELAFTFVLTGATALALAFALLEGRRAHLRAALAPMLGAGVAAAVLTSPFVYYALTGPVIEQVFQHYGDTFGADALGLVVPTALTGVGGAQFSNLTLNWGGNGAENGVYLGLPLLAVVAGYGIAQRRAAATRMLLALLGVVVVLMLGAHLHIAGHRTIALPWNWLDRLPLLQHVIPERLGLYMFLLVAVIVSLWLAEPAPGRLGALRWGLAGLAVALVVPNLAGAPWHSSVHNPPFFTSGQYRRILRPGENVLAFPYAQFGDTMLWQADTGMWFRLAGGYLGPLWRLNYIPAPFSAPQVAADPGTVSTFLALHRVGAVIVDSHHPQQWPALLARLGLRPISLGGVTVYNVPGA